MVSIVEKHNVDESMNHELVHILYFSVVRQEIDASAKSVRRRFDGRKGGFARRIDKMV